MGITPEETAIENLEEAQKPKIKPFAARHRRSRPAKIRAIRG
jgi:plasmid stability protein